MNKIRTTRTMAALLLTTLLAACGGGGSSQTPVTLPAPVPQVPGTPPVTPPTPGVPTTLWSAAVGSVPATNNYMYLESTTGDPIGSGVTYTYTQANTTIKVDPSGGHLILSIDGDEAWSGDFQSPTGVSALVPGYYGGLTRSRIINPPEGGLNWVGNGHSCSELTGWFVVDKATYLSGTLTALDLRFEQRCNNGSGVDSPGVLHGQLHWMASDLSKPPGPVSPPPSNLWKPDITFFPPAGNYVYLVSETGDFIGQGATEVLTTGNSTISVTNNLTAAMHITVGGIGGWSGDFYGMNVVSQLQPGYYPGLQRFPFNNPNKGGLNWSGNGRGCNKLSGWFVVDSVTYASSVLKAIDLRFEQHCDGATPSQHGKIHWVGP